MREDMTANFSRRSFLQVGALGLTGLTLADYLRAAPPASTAKSAIFVYLGGGPTHMDTFDLKPEAAAEFRGDFKPIATDVPGIQISEHLPKLAKQMKDVALVRGISHTLAGHELGTAYVNTGNRPIPSLLYPGLGAVVSKELQGDKDLPHYVAIPSTPQKAGYLGVRYAPLLTNTTPSAGVPFAVRGISLGNGMTVAEYGKRQKLLSQLDTTFGSAEESKLVDGLDKFAQQAFDMISSPKAKQAFDVSLEKPEVAERFGPGKFAMSCLLAARLIDAGVRFTTVSFGGWDTHSNNFKATKDNLLPQLDTGLSALLTTLKERGQLASTTVYVIGEFGRTPKINPNAGRDHWPRAMFALLAGGGIKGGQVLGKSDDKGMGPAGDPITPDQVSATFYSTLGIDHQKEYHTPTGRPVMIVRDGTVLKQLV